jgi:hypothetical protein
VKAGAWCLEWDWLGGEVTWVSFFRLDEDAFIVDCLVTFWVDYMRQTS